jgi:hypothetical protein
MPDLAFRREAAARRATRAVERRKLLIGPRFRHFRAGAPFRRAIVVESKLRIAA